MKRESRLGLVPFDLQAVTLDHFAVRDDPRWPAVPAGSRST